MRTLLLAPFAMLLACAAPRSLPSPATPLARRPPISLKHDSGDERRTRSQLEALFTRYDLAAWMLAPSIAIDRDCIPHSHPVLTLHTRHLRDDLLLLSTLIHEQSHWRHHQHRAAVARAVAELKLLFPNLPVGFPDGANTIESSYQHLVIIAWEEQGLEALVGELAARQAMEFWATDHYRAVYRTVLDHRRKIWAVLRKHGL